MSENTTRTTRHEQRKKLVELLYAMDIHGSFQYEPQEHVFEDDILRRLVSMIESLDEILESHLFNYRLKRLNYVDRAILRLAVFELSETDTPVEVIIDEALKLTRSLSDEGDNKHVAFNNRVLENVKNTLRKA